MKLIWVDDPKNNKPSVSLTAFWLTLILVLVLSVLEAAEKIKMPAYLLEVLVTTSVLYFGRRASFKTKHIEMDNKSNEK